MHGVGWELPGVGALAGPCCAGVQREGQMPSCGFFFAGARNPGRVAGWSHEAADACELDALFVAGRSVDAGVWEAADVEDTISGRGGVVAKLVRCRTVGAGR